jgi:hypothetical protein
VSSEGLRGYLVEGVGTSVRMLELDELAEWSVSRGRGRASRE